MVPTRRGFVRMYDPDFWSKFNPMDWCYGDAVFNDPRRERQLTFEQYCENLLRREELEYDVYEGERGFNLRIFFRFLDSIVSFFVLCSRQKHTT